MIRAYSEYWGIPYIVLQFLHTVTLQENMSLVSYLVCDIYLWVETPLVFVRIFVKLDRRLWMVHRLAFLSVVEEKISH